MNPDSKLTKASGNIGGKEMRGRFSSTVPILLFIALSSLPATSYSQHVNPKCCDYPAKPSAVKLQFFLEACAVPGQTERGMIPYFDCQSYVLGVIDAYRKVKNTIPKQEQICIPDNITTREILESIWKKYPNWNVPEQRDASEVVLEVLRDKFLCRK